MNLDAEAAEEPDGDYMVLKITITFIAANIFFHLTSSKLL